MMAFIKDESGSTSMERATGPNAGADTRTAKSFADNSPDTTAVSTSQHSNRHLNDDMANTAINPAKEPVIPETGTPPPLSNDINLEHISTPLVTDTETNQLLKDILQTLKTSTIAQEIGMDSRSRLWATYRREAKEFDDEFLEKYRDDMDIVLIFAGLFSAVSTTFITSMQSNLSPDATATTNVLLMQLVHAANTTAFAGQNLELPSWNGPGSTMIWTQSLIYASLAASLLAALGAVLGKQWLAHYCQSKFGTSEQRALHRQAKSNALERWRFQAILAVLPVLLQISLLLFGIALSGFHARLSLPHTADVCDKIPLATYCTARENCENFHKGQHGRRGHD
ncbi:hypothetical protein BJ138DRAFT_340116 [Hygrophoropsis aurantiaca]|uniref:Uncharacterized protein n=1 Tax=Hygrophoropsis aurantiaca TaxID=72124 RepID=A0ACB8A5T3_9AGAM|nr:hypothetical protein BJ138DRAFT_340116 [Hygrophoropsis aurantiaca]